jgi:hypothetical protein
MLFDETDCHGGCIARDRVVTDCDLIERNIDAAVKGKGKGPASFRSGYVIPRQCRVEQPPRSRNSQLVRPTAKLLAHPG